MDDRLSKDLWWIDRIEKLGLLREVELGDAAMLLQAAFCATGAGLIPGSARKRLPRHRLVRLIHSIDDMVDRNSI